MSTIKVDTIVDEAGSGAPNFSQGATVTGTLSATTLSATTVTSTTVKPTTYQETYIANATGATTTLDLATGTNFTLVITQPAAAKTIAWPASVDWAAATAPDAPGNSEVNAYGFMTRDGGTTYYGFLGGAALG